MRKNGAFDFVLLVALAVALSCIPQYSEARQLYLEEARLLMAAAEVSTSRPGKGPQPAEQSLGEDGAMHIGASDRCPVCAMKISDHSSFASAIQLRDGRTYYFCGTGCMIRSWLHPENFLGVGKDQLSRAVVRDYFTGEPCDATDVTWIAGSDVVGPMGPAVVPIKDEKDIPAFQRRHGGKATFHLLDLDDEKWNAFTGKTSLPVDRK